MAKGELSDALQLPRASNRIRELRALVVDEDRHMRKVLRMLLLGYGVKEVFDAQDGQSGINLMADVRPHFVVTDYDMKPMSGLAFVKKLRWECAPPMCSVPVILMTAHADMKRIQAARDTGVTEALCKPVTAKTLFDRVLEIIERPRSFVRTPAFVGPDRRRRRRDSGYNGPKRRSEDAGVEIEYLD